MNVEPTKGVAILLEVVEKSFSDSHGGPFRNISTGSHSERGCGRKRKE